MEAFNKDMSQVRVSVEWLFGDTVNYFKFLDFKKNLKIGMSSIGKLYLVSALLQNAITCMEITYQNSLTYSHHHYSTIFSEWVGLWNDMRI